ncbi:hypothetical protein [Yinghuangia sp. YIM S09857]|uniref:hypothetical protein n=1 Tax=Yinghuangia sp. YIM S09857 TaxID=3436929 RepID=UPI003F538890
MDVDGVLAVVRAKAARAEHDLAYAAALERAAAVEDDALSAEEFEDFSAYETAEHDAEQSGEQDGESNGGQSGEHNDEGRRSGVCESKTKCSVFRHVRAKEWPFDFLRKSAAADWQSLCLVAEASTSAVRESMVRRLADDGNAHAAACVGSLHEHRHDATGAMRWYLQAHYGGSSLGTFALARIGYDRGAREPAARLLADAWETDLALIRRVFDHMDASQAKRRRRRSAGAADPEAPLHSILHKMHLGMKMIPPVLPAESFDSEVVKTASSHVLVYFVHDSSNDACWDYLQPFGDMGDSFDGDARSVVADFVKTYLRTSASSGRRLVDDLKSLERLWGTRNGGDGAPSRGGPVPHACGLPEH